MNDDDPSLSEVINALLATQMLHGLRIEALQKITLSALAELGFQSPTHDSFHDQMNDLVKEGAERLLAGISDDDPALATTLKSLLDTLQHPS